MMIVDKKEVVTYVSLAVETCNYAGCNNELKNIYLSLCCLLLFIVLLYLFPSRSSVYVHNMREECEVFMPLYFDCKITSTDL